MNWQKAIGCDALETEKPVVFKHAGKQICMLKREGKIFAFDNRCPHEGFPLSEGTVNDSCVLTCNWHNWKFDLEDGANLFGDDNLRVYDTKTEDGQVFVDLTEPPREEVRADLLKNLKTAFEDRDYGRIARVLAKFHFHGFDTRLAVRHAVSWSHDRFEYGMTHAFAAGADWLALQREFGANPETALTPVAEFIDHMAYDALRQPRFPFTEETATFSESAFREAVETEDENQAVSMLNGALANGKKVADLSPMLAEIALRHYNDFGHSLIYVNKAEALIAALGPETEGPVLRALTRSLCYATREDLLPEFRRYASFLDGLSELDRSPGKPRRSTPLTDPFGLPVNRAMAWVVEALRHHEPNVVFQALFSAAARNMVYLDTGYDARHDLPPAKSVGWLDFTHALTFANALHRRCETTPHLWGPGLLQLACFTGRVSGFLDREQNIEEWRVEDEAGFMSRALARVLDHGYDHPIYACHLLKTSLAVREELPHLDGETQSWALAALNRFLHSPMKQKHGKRLVSQALKLVGKDFPRARTTGP